MNTSFNFLIVYESVSYYVPEKGNFEEKNQQVTKIIKDFPELQRAICDCTDIKVEIIFIDFIAM